VRIARSQALQADLLHEFQAGGKNAIHAAKRKFSKKKYLKNLFHCYSFIARFKYCLHRLHRCFRLAACRELHI
jgi:hypothetical protein